MLGTAERAVGGPVPGAAFERWAEGVRAAPTEPSVIAFARVAGDRLVLQGPCTAVSARTWHCSGRAAGLRAPVAYVVPKTEVDLAVADRGPRTEPTKWDVANLVS